MQALTSTSAWGKSKRVNLLRVAVFVLLVLQEIATTEELPRKQRSPDHSQNYNRRGQASLNKVVLAFVG